MEQILTDLYHRLTSRTFLILVISVILLVNNSITMNEFLSINGVSVVGFAAKDVVNKIPKKEEEKKES